MPRKRKQRRAAWASITQIDESRYRIRFWGKDSNGTYRRMSRTVRGTRLDAERVRSELMLEHSEDAPCPTVAQAWERWVLPSYERRVEQGTLRESSLNLYVGAWGRHVSPTWSAVQLDAVRPLRVQQWLDTLGASAAATSVKVMNAIMDAAVRYECIDHNPMRERYVMPSKATVKAQDAGIWTLAELRAMSTAMQGQWYEPAMLLSAFGGLRVGEALGVRASDVELRMVDAVPVAFVRVERQVNRDGAVVESLKTEQSRRTAYLVGKAALRLSEIARAMDGTWYLTHDGIGGAQSQNRLYHTWRDAGTEHPFRNLRNSWQTWMRWEAGIAPWAIETAMGHKFGGVTGQYYDRPTADVIAAVFADAYRAKPWD